MGLSLFKEQVPRDENPVVIAAYWKTVLDGYIEQVIDISVNSFKSKSKDAVKTVRECASHLDKVAKDVGISKTVGGSAAVLGSTMAIGGLIVAPFTAGLSLGLTLGGAGLGIAGGLTTVTGALINQGWEKSDTERARESTTSIIRIIQDFEEFLTICVDAFTRAQEYLETDEGKKFTALLDEAVRNKGHITSKSQHLEKLTVSASLAYTVMKGGITTYKSVGVVQFIMSGTYARAGVQTALAMQEGAGGLFIAGRYIVMVGSTGAKVLSAGFGVLGVGLGIWDIVSGAKAITSGSDTAKEMKEFADNLDTTTKELLSIYSKLTR